MKTNVGALDKVTRVAVGIVVLSLLFLLESNARWFGLIGVVPLVTGLIGYCPLYTMLGVNTCPAGPKARAT